MHNLPPNECNETHCKRPISLGAPQLLGRQCIWKLKFHFAIDFADEDVTPMGVQDACLHRNLPGGLDSFNQFKLAQQDVWQAGGIIILNIHV